MPSTISPNDPLTQEFTAAFNEQEKLGAEVITLGNQKIAPSAELIERWRIAQERLAAAFQALQRRG